MRRIAILAVLLTGCGVAEQPVQRAPERACTRPDGVAAIGFSATKYPNIRRHYLRAVRRGWPRVLVLHRSGADSRRDRLLDAYPTRDGYDRDEYPPAVGRGAAPPTSRTCRARRIAPTAPRWASSCGGSATARGSGTSSTDPAAS